MDIDIDLLESIEELNNLKNGPSYSAVRQHLKNVLILRGYTIDRADQIIEELLEKLNFKLSKQVLIIY